MHEVALQTLLGPVLIATKGQAVPEVQEIYVRARHLCQHIGDSPQLFSALWGLWRFYNNLPRLIEAQEVSEQLLHLAKRLQDTGLIMQAHIARGVTLIYLGAFEMARNDLEYALELYDPSQHHVLSHMYGGHDPEVYALTNQAYVLWRLGFPNQAMAKNQNALALARQLAHPNTMASALNFAGLVHELRREPERAQALMEEQIAIASEHGFNLWQATGTIMQGWA